MEALQKGDLSVLKKIGLKPEDIRKFSEQELQEYLDEQDMNPDQRALAETRIERDLLKAQTEQLNQKAVEDKREEEAQRAGERIDTEMRDALEGSKIPLKGNFKLVRRVAEDMYSQIEAGNVANASQSLTRVLVGLSDDFSEHATREFARDAEGFLKGLPKGVLDGIRKMSLKEVKSQLPIGNLGEKDLTKKSVKTDSFRDYMRAEFRKPG